MSGNGTEFDERVPHRVGASLGQRDIEGFIAGIVGVAGDGGDGQAAFGAE